MHDFSIRIRATVANPDMLGEGGAAMAKASEDDLREAYAAWDAAFTKGDAKALAAPYVDDAMFLPANHAIIKKTQRR